MSVGVLKGRCGCRVVEFEVSDDFVEAYNCHCSNCRAMTGSVFKPWGEIEPEKMRLTQGASSLVVQGEADGHHAVRCEVCFSLLYWSGYEGKIRIPYGTLIDEPVLKPMAHIFVGSKASWYEILDDLPQYDESPWSGSPPPVGDIPDAGQPVLALPSNSRNTGDGVDERNSSHSR